ncbi:phosphotransferase [Paenibacillus sp. MWE-103]|uniref:Phosphotransferase n=1 Tax=Paenibacillus artemisiicola TaxID=1172618 RepID=A0ABS3W3F9_9BACL|nr:phosphotransferase [Paenibacillus artemisiicola]MBO7742838.1 phosphotransferase [Paenibacillus artemisiicola]
MHRHQHFDLMLHDDGELAEVLGSPVTERTVIHEWPLSCVQRVRTADGTSHIYKVQAPPTLEAEFYAKARSPLLAAARVLETAGRPAALVMADIGAPRLGDLGLSEPEAVAAADELLAGIAAIEAIEGDLPAMADLRTEERFAAYIGAALDDVQASVDDGSFVQVDDATVGRLRRWSGAAALRAAFRAPSGYVHSDFKADNVLAAPDGYRILDWQRPILAPVALDRATLLLSLGLDPARYVEPGIVQLYRYLHIAWYAQAGRRWFPQGKPWFDGIIAKLAGELERLQPEG